MTERLVKINTLGKRNKSKLLKELGYRTINDAIEAYATNADFKKLKKYTDKVKDNTFRLMQNEYNDIIDDLQNQKKEIIKTEKKVKQETKKQTKTSI